MLSIEALLDPQRPCAALAAEAFASPPDAQIRSLAFNGELELDESPMQVEPSDTECGQLGAGIDRFPAVILAFASAGNRLVPASQQIHSARGGESFWQVIPGPGRVWREARDGEWQRGAFPFTLGNATDSVTYQGLGLFAYRRRDPGHLEVSRLRFQWSEGGIPYHLPHGLHGWGSAACRWRVADGAHPSRDPSSGDDGFRWLSWNDLRDRCPGELVDSVHRGPGADTVVITALATAGGEMHATAGRTRWGDHPYPSAIRHGIWSASKSAGAGVAALHLAERYGAEILDLPVADLLDVTASHDGWAEVCLRHCYDMATGIGDEGPAASPPAIFADYDIDPVQFPVQAERYQRWFTAPSRAQRLDAVFRHPSYPWPPGTVARYRDQDFFTLTACLDALVKRREGPSVHLWELMREAVYAPLGIRDAPVNRTPRARRCAGDTTARRRHVPHPGGDRTNRTPLSRPGSASRTPASSSREGPRGDRSASDQGPADRPAHH